MNPASEITRIILSTDVVINELSHQLSAIRDAPENVRALLKEVAICKEFVNSSEKVLRHSIWSLLTIHEITLAYPFRDERVSAARKNHFISSTGLSINRARKAVNDVGNAVEDAFRALQGFRRVDKCEELQVRLIRLRRELFRSFQRLQREYFSQISRDLRDLRTVEHCLEVEKVAQADRRLCLYESLLKNVWQPETISGSDPAYDKKESTSLDRIKNPETQPEGSVTHPGFEVIYLPLSCPEFCRCPCHTVISPQHLNSFPRKKSFICAVGPLFLVGGCSMSECQTSKDLRPAIEIHSKLFRQIITISLLWHRTKLKASLRDHPIVPKSSRIMNYVCKGNLVGLRVLLETRVASINDATADGWSLLQAATFNGRTSIVKYLLDQGADFTADNITRNLVRSVMIKAVRKSASTEEKQLFMLLSHAEEDFRENTQLTPIHTAVLGLYGASDYGRSLSELCQSMHHPAQSLLVNEVYHFARRSADKTRSSDWEDKSSRDLVNWSDTYGWSPLHWAASIGRCDYVKTLLEHGANCHLLTLSGRNILHQAAASGDKETLAYLVEEPYPEKERNFEISRADMWGITPLHIAATRSAACVTVLLQAGAKVDTLTSEHLTPLHYSVLAGNSERLTIITLLSEGGSKIVNTQDLNGMSPLFHLLGSPDCGRLLIDRGAKLDVRDHSGKTVFDHALLGDHHETLWLLQHYSGEDKTVFDGTLDNELPADAIAGRVSGRMGTLQIETDCIPVHQKLETGLQDDWSQDGISGSSTAVDSYDDDKVPLQLKQDLYRSPTTTSQGEATVETTQPEGRSGVTKVKTRSLVPNPGRLDQIKGLAERLTGDPINWWPLAPRTTSCTEGHARLSWFCKCGVELYIDVPSNSVDDFVEQRGPVTSTPSEQPILPVHNAMLTGTTLGSSTSSQNSMSERSSFPQRSLDQPDSIRRRLRESDQAEINSIHSRDRYVLWCVDANRMETHLIHVPVPSINDTTLIHRLKSAYSSIYGFRRWFSLTMCYGVRFVVFERAHRSKDLVACGNEDLPCVKTNADYEYTYLDPRDQFIKTLERSFMHLFDSPYGCEAQDIEDVIRRIPKKIKGRLEKRYGATGYGMHAITGWSFLKFFTVFALSQIGPTIFAIRWLCGHPGDLQNAFTLSMYLVGLLNLLVIIPDIWRMQK